MKGEEIFQRAARKSYIYVEGECYSLVSADGVSILRHADGRVILADEDYPNITESMLSDSIDVPDEDYSTPPYRGNPWGGPNKKLS